MTTRTLADLRAATDALRAQTLPAIPTPAQILADRIMMTTTDRELVMAVARANRAKFANNLRRHYHCRDGGIGDDGRIWIIHEIRSVPFTDPDFAYVAKAMREGKW